MTCECGAIWQQDPIGSRKFLWLAKAFELEHALHRETIPNDTRENTENVLTEL